MKVAETTMKFFWYSTDAEKPATDTAAVTYNTTERTLENKVIVINKYNINREIFSLLKGFCPVQEACNHQHSNNGYSLCYQSHISNFFVRVLESERKKMHTQDYSGKCGTSHTECGVPTERESFLPTKCVHVPKTIHT